MSAFAISQDGEEATHIREACRVASTILDYEGGDTTWIAASFPAKKIIALMDSRSRAIDLADKIAETDIASMPLVHCAVDQLTDNSTNGDMSRIIKFAMSPWTDPRLPRADLVTLGPKHGIVCALATCIGAQKPTRLLLRDYPVIHGISIIENLLGPPEKHGGIAEFYVEPGATKIAVADLPDLLKEAVGPEKLAWKYFAEPSEHISRKRPPRWTSSNDDEPRRGTASKLANAKLRRFLSLDQAVNAPVAILKAMTLPAWVVYALARELIRKRRRRVATRLKSNNERAIVPIAKTAIRNAEAEAAITKRPDDFVLYRIIGNDLAPRHGEGQSLRNVQFILNNEPDLEGCRKRWILNRIHDKDTENKIISILRAHGQDFERIPFDFDEYAKISFDYARFPSPDFFWTDDFATLPVEKRRRAVVHAYRLKNNYVMNNNGARNIALEMGRKEAKWVMPWDGNCFLTDRAWDEVRTAVIEKKFRRYFAVPMVRIASTAKLTDPDWRPLAEDEPQLLFRFDAPETFDSQYPYGRRPKVELLARLGFDGPWRSWRSDPWDLPLTIRHGDPNEIGTAGWVVRLNSGKPDLEGATKTMSRDRAAARDTAIVMTIDELDDEVLRRRAPWYPMSNVQIADPFSDHGCGRNAAKPHRMAKSKFF